jgi:hypothetical protein
MSIVISRVFFSSSEASCTQTIAQCSKLKDELYKLRLTDQTKDQHYAVSLSIDFYEIFASDV